MEQPGRPARPRFHGGFLYRGCSVQQEARKQQEDARGGRRSEPEVRVLTVGIKPQVSGTLPEGRQGHSYVEACFGREYLTRNGIFS